VPWEQQECTQMRQLLSTVHSSLAECRNVLKGLLTASAEFKLFLMFHGCDDLL
jgi:hypothetical protein